MVVKKTKVSFYILSWLVLLSGSFVFFLWGNTREILWYDEALCALIAQKSFGGVIKALSTDVYPPLYFMSLKIYTAIFGTSVFAYRSFSALGAVALLVLGAGPIRRLLGERGALIYAILFLACPMTLIMAQDCKMYTWAAFFVTGAFAYAILSWRDGKRTDWMLWGLFTLCAGYNHYFALLPLIILGFFGLTWIVLRDRQKLKPFLMISLVLLLCYLPWMSFFIKQTQSVLSSFWIPPVNIWAVLAVLAYPFSYKFSQPPEYTILPALLLTFFCMVHGVRGEQGRPLDRPAGVAAGVFFLTLFTLFLLSVSIQPVLTPRYLYPSVGLFFLPVVAGILRMRKQSLQAAVCLAFFALSIPQFIKIETQYFNGPRPAMVNYLQKRLLPGDVIIHTNVHTPAICAFYLPLRQQYFYIGKGFKVYDNYEMFKPALQVSSDLSSLVRNKQRVWLVDARNKYLSDEHNRNFGQPWVFDFFIPLPESKTERLSFQETCSWFMVEMACMRPDHARIASLQEVRRITLLR